jgi:toxin ParE1/3/4
MSRYSFAPAAREDLKDIHRHIASHNRVAARRLRQRFTDAFCMLAGNPLLGEACEHFAPGLRMFTVGNYVIFYRPKDGGIVIIHVVHGARDLPGVFGSSGD